MSDSYDHNKKNIFDQLLLDYEIELKQALAVRKYAVLSQDGKDEIKKGNAPTQESFLCLDLALQSAHTLCGDSSEHRSHRVYTLAKCKLAIQELVREFRLVQRRDPRRIIASSTYCLSRLKPE